MRQLSDVESIGWRLAKLNDVCESGAKAVTLDMVAPFIWRDIPALIAEIKRLRENDGIRGNDPLLKEHLSISESCGLGNNFSASGPACVVLSKFEEWKARMARGAK